MKTLFDTIVVGLGAMGSATVYQLAQQGHRVLGIDQFSPPHDQGSTHGGSRIIRLAYQEGIEYVPLLQRAYTSWREIEAATGKSLLQITGGLMLGSRQDSIVDRSQKSADSGAVSYEILDTPEIGKRFPQFQVQDDTVALYDPVAGILNPEAGVAAQLELAARADAEIRLNEQVLRWEAHPSGSGVMVSTSQGTYAAKNIVLCTGPWAGPILAQLGISLEVERVIQFWMEPKIPFSHFSPDRFPIFLWTVDPHMEIYGFPGINGQEGGVKVSFYPKGPHPMRKLCNPDQISRTVKDDDLSAMRHYLQLLLPDLDGPCLRTMTCMHSTTPDMHPVICAHPEHPQVILAAGFSGHGFKFSNVIGEILSDLAREQTSPFDLSLFRPDRFQ